MAVFVLRSEETLSSNNLCTFFRTKTMMEKTMVEDDYGEHLGGRLWWLKTKAEKD